ncbi:hypothetical protein F4778DRAFT_151602 [Xylariomycetidae sp. FL2044]|nr:hypothetical protein F4778DRAFT_151602 [Xylariomycetidae sp. FL2044]
MLQGTSSKAKRGTNNKQNERIGGEHCRDRSGLPIRGLAVCFDVYYHLGRHGYSRRPALHVQLEIPRQDPHQLPPTLSQACHFPGSFWNDNVLLVTPSFGQAKTLLHPSSTRSKTSSGLAPYESTLLCTNLGSSVVRARVDCDSADRSFPYPYNTTPRSSTALTLCERVPIEFASMREEPSALSPVSDHALVRADSSRILLPLRPAFFSRRCRDGYTTANVIRMSPDVTSAGFA